VEGMEEIFDESTKIDVMGTNPAELEVSVNNMTNYSINGDFQDAQLYQVPLGVVVMLSTFYGTISLAAVAGNGLVLWVVLVRNLFSLKFSCMLAVSVGLKVLSQVHGDELNNINEFSRA